MPNKARAATLNNCPESKGQKVSLKKKNPEEIAYILTLMIFIYLNPDCFCYFKCHLTSCPTSSQGGVHLCT